MLKITEVTSLESKNIGCTYLTLHIISVIVTLTKKINMESIFDKVWENKVAFLGVFFVVFTLTYIVFVAIDFLPEPKAIEVEEVNGAETIDETDFQNEVETLDAAITEVDEAILELDDTNKNKESKVDNEVVNNTILDYQNFPIRIVIDEIGKDIMVLNPESRAIADLDTALLDGVVRHPDSATLGQEGSVFILGHSSYLPTVFNKNFQAFNGIQNLKWGDIIKVYSDDSVFEYRVEKVYRATAQDLTVPIAGTEKRLTLATCNSFGSTDDRFIVEAIQTSSASL